MLRRRILIGILILATVVVAGYGLLWWCFAPPASAINRANAMRIKVGMTLADVEGILGGPERDELAFGLDRYVMSSVVDEYCYFVKEADGTKKRCYSMSGELSTYLAGALQPRYESGGTWVSTECIVTIWFGKGPIVLKTNVADVIREYEPSVWERVRGHLRKKIGI